MKSIKNENGAIMVEAAIYIPLVFCTVMALLYIAIFNMQEYLMMYQVQKISNIVAREQVYLGYDAFGMGVDKNIDFSWSGDTPSEDTVTSYYKAHHSNIGRLYREITGTFNVITGAGADTQTYEGRLKDELVNSALIAVGTIGAPDINVNSGFLGSGITVTITHSLEMPGVLAYLGYDGIRTLQASTYTYAVNSTEFVRNVDLACDCVNYIFEKFNVDFSSFKSKVNAVLDKVL